MKEMITNETSSIIMTLATEIENATMSRFIWKGLNSDKEEAAYQRKEKAFEELIQLLIKLEKDEA